MSNNILNTDATTPSDSIIDSDSAARKRQQIGLAPRRETAKASIMRPPTEAKRARPVFTRRRLLRPDEAARAGPGSWWLVFLLSSLAVITFLLVSARFLSSPTSIAAVQAELEQTTGRELTVTGWQPLVALSERLDRWGVAQLFRREARQVAPWVSDEFEEGNAVLARLEQSQQWVLGTVPGEGVYRMRVWPGFATWSNLGLKKPVYNYRWETKVQISEATPASIAGVLLRFADEFNFYLFTIDGKQRYQLQALIDGKWQMVKPWTDSALLLPAGQDNQLTVEDSGDQVRFAVNGKTLYIELDPPLAVGDVGLWGAAESQTAAQLEYAWVRLSALR